MELHAMNADPIEQLRDKLKAKMEVAKFFAGFISVVFGFLLREGFGATEQLAAYIAILLFTASLTFSIATVFAYDLLLMPIVFWQPQPTPDALRHEMVLAWQRLFVPAVVSLIVGLLAAIVTVTHAVWTSLVVWLIPVGVASAAYFYFSRRIRFVD
jgi:uncharacterized membrane protein